MPLFISSSRGRRSRPLVLVVLPMLLLASSPGCMLPPEVDLFPLVQGAPPRPDDWPVRFFPAGDAPHCAYEEIGVLEATGGDYGIWAETTAVVIRQRVRRMGGDAVIGLAEREVVEGTSITRDSSAAINQKSVRVERIRSRTLRGTVVRFTEPACVGR